jgi:hypothetical protein
MNLLRRFTERLIVAVFSFGLLWLAVMQIFERLDDRMPVFLAGVITYIFAAYILFPRIIQFFLMIIRRGRIPRFTRTADGLAADPINIILVGSEESLKKAFVLAGWYEADPLTWKTSFKMSLAFIRNTNYFTAPFSYQYLFGRRQDFGFQLPIGESPRRRHHIRLWAANLDPEVDLANLKYWLQKHDIDPSQATMWVGSGSKDIGFGLTRMTYQLSHKVDKNVDEERDYIIASLRDSGQIAKEEYFDPGKFIVRKYKSDGRILVAYLK